MKQIDIRKIVVAVLLVSASSPSYAYLDPGTGSILLQGLLASIAAGIGIARLYWQRIKAFFSPGTSVSIDELPSGDDLDAKAPESSKL